MVVYWEYAFLGNALMDGVLLFLALRCARIRVRLWRLLLAGAAGGAFAVLFPLMALPAWAAYAVKVLFGVALVLAAASARRVGGYVRAVLFFFALTFALGGLLTAVYAFFGIETADGTGFYLERAPVTLILAGSAVFAVCVLFAARALWKTRVLRRNTVVCRLCAGGRSVQWEGLADSGNALTYRGEPVCVISAAGAFALFGAHPQAVGRMYIGTVNGGREAPVFRCDSLTAGGEEHRGVYLTVGDVGRRFQIILHTAFTEGQHEHPRRIEGVA